MKKIFYFSATLIILAAGACSSGKGGGDDGKKREDLVLTRTETEIANANNGFAFDIYRKINSGVNSQGNTVFSPLSLSLALSMLNNGAVGETQEQIVGTLGFTGKTAGDINGFYRKMLDAAVGLDPKVTIESANSIWIANNFPVKQSFVDVNVEWYDAAIRNVDFGASGTLKAINDWASDNTHGKIKDVLRQLDPQTVVLLMNALYYKGTWASEFKQSNTYDADFTKADGSNVKVKMMKQTLSTEYTENELYSSARLPFGNGAFYMSFILPNEGVTISDVLAGISDETVSGTDMPPYTNEVIFGLPRFKTEYDVELTDYFKDLGMRIPFTPSADFSAMHSSNDAVYVSLIKQKAFVEVDEKGAEAAAVTVVSTAVTSVGPGQEVPFILNRPFLFLIREHSTGVIYFMGEVNDPSR